MNIDKVGGEDFRHPLNPPAEEGFGQLPNDILRLILTESGANVQSTGLVSRHWYAITVDSVLRQQFSDMEHLINLILENLPDKYAIVKQQIKLILSDKKIFNSINITQVISSLDGLKESLITELNKLEHEDFQRLAQKIVPETRGTLRNIFNLASTYSEIDEVKKWENDEEKNSQLHSIFRRGGYLEISTSNWLK